MPVYYGYLPRVYHIIGSVVVHGTGREYQFDETAILRSAVVTAKLHGADAFCLKPMTDKEKSVMRGDGPAVTAWGHAIKWGPRPPRDNTRL